MYMSDNCLLASSLRLAPSLTSLIMCIRLVHLHHRSARCRLGTRLSRVRANPQQFKSTEYIIATALTVKSCNSPVEGG